MSIAMILLEENSVSMNFDISSTASWKHRRDHGSESNLKDSLTTPPPLNARLKSFRKHRKVLLTPLKTLSAEVCLLHETDINTVSLKSRRDMLD
jgi:hypothetical protein